METFSVVPFLQIGFYIVAIMYAIFTAVLFYHWQSYSMSSTVTMQTYLAYAICSLPLLAIMAVISFL